MTGPPGLSRSAAAASWLLGAIAEELEATGNPVGVVLLAPGGRPPPADWCCTTEDGGAGMAWVRINRRYASSRFPAQDAAPARCGRGWAAELEAGVYRCAHTLDDTGAPPAPQDVSADALMIDADAHALLAACCRLRWAHVLGGWTALGPSGGIVGGAQTVYVALEQGPIGREHPS